MTFSNDDILDGLFHACALRAWLDQAAEEQRWPPDSNATKQRAYKYYEDALAEQNRLKSLLQSDDNGEGRLNFRPPAPPNPSP